jgi:hypothetical protein
MSWTTINDIKRQLQKRWESGDLLRSLIEDTALFPMRLSLKVPTSADLSERFAEVRLWLTGLSEIKGLRIEWHDVQHRQLGRQRLPHTVWIDRLDDALQLIGKRQDAVRFTELLTHTRSSHSALRPWLTKRPLQALALAQDWSQLLAVVSWLQAHPRPHIYVRQVDIPSVDTKFIEAQRGVLSELLDVGLPQEMVDSSKSGISQFAARYGFLEKPTRIRFRLLDTNIALLAHAPFADITLDAASFAALEFAGVRVFITENETNFLAFPMQPNAIVIFGAGYGWEALAHATWLHDCSIYYWGDIDTHGFAILDQLRRHFSHANSLLMDKSTLLAHERCWGKEMTPISHDLPRLTDDERTVFNDLRDNRLRPQLRLEQEKIGFGWLTAVLKELT